jgi:hypothetical protein
VEVLGEGVLQIVEGVALGAAIVVPPDHEDLKMFPVAVLGLLGEAEELVVGELDEVGAEGSPLEEVPADEDVVDPGLDDGVHRLGECLAEGPAPVLCYREGDATPDVGVGEDRKPHSVTYTGLASKSVCARGINLFSLVN